MVSAVREIFARFLRAGEGRIEDFSGYTDACTPGGGSSRRRATWCCAGTAPGGEARIRRISETWRGHQHALHPRVRLRRARADPSSRTRAAAQAPGVLPARGRVPRRLPRPHLQRPELPTNMAAMSDVKCALRRGSEPAVRRRVGRDPTELPERCATAGTASRSSPATFVPGVPFAGAPGGRAARAIPRRPHMVDELLGELSSRRAREVLSAPPSKQSSSASATADAAERSRLRRRARRSCRVASCARSGRRRDRASTLGRLAFSAYLASRMTAMLREDAEPAPASSGRGRDRTTSQRRASRKVEAGRGSSNGQDDAPVVGPVLGQRDRRGLLRSLGRHGVPMWALDPNR